jgi:iron(III) transport system permease protein
MTTDAQSHTAASGPSQKAGPEAAGGWSPAGESIRWLRSHIRQPAWLVLVIALAFLVLWPILQLQLRAFANGSDGYKQFFHLYGLSTILLNTLELGVGSALLSVVLATILALCVLRLPRRARWLSAIPLIPLVIPFSAAVTGWMFLLSPNVGYINELLRMLPMFSSMSAGPVNVNSKLWIIILSGFSLTSFVYVFVTASLRNRGFGYEAAATANGASSARVLFTVTIPLLRPALVYSGGIVLLLGAGELTAPLILGNGRVPVLTTTMFLLTQNYPTDYGLGAALGAPLLLLGILVVIGQRLLIGKESRFTIATSQQSVTALKPRPRWWALVVVALYGFFSTALPILALLYVGLNPFWDGSFRVNKLTTSNISAVLADPTVLAAIKTSAIASVSAVAIVLLVGLAASWGLLGRGHIPRTLRGVLDLLVQLPIMVPAAMLGFGLLFTYSQPPLVLYGTTAVLVVTYVTLMIPYSTRMQLTSFISLGSQSWEASRACGAGPMRTYFEIVLPLTRRALAATSALMIILLMYEFNASLMVRANNTQVLGSELYNYFQAGNYPRVAVLALVMVVVTAVGVSAALMLGGSRALERS